MDAYHFKNSVCEHCTQKLFFISCLFPFHFEKFPYAVDVGVRKPSRDQKSVPVCISHRIIASENNLSSTVATSGLQNIVFTSSVLHDAFLSFLTCTPRNSKLLAFSTCIPAVVIEFSILRFSRIMVFHVLLSLAYPLVINVLLL